MRFTFYIDLLVYFSCERLHSLHTLWENLLSAPNIIHDEASVTAVVHAAMAATADPRLRQIIRALVDHSHALIREVDLTEAEFETALKFLVEIGQQTNDHHNEVVLAADVLGLSTLVALRNNPQNLGQTASALLGPFWRAASPLCANGDSIARSDLEGPVMHVSGQVRGVHGEPIAGAVVDVWQASPVGLYENQDEQQPPMNLRGRFHTDTEGRYSFRTVRPAGYPVPTSGAVGVLLQAQNRHCMRPAHIHFMVSKPDYKTLITQVFSDESEHLASDVVFGVTASLVGKFARHGAAPSSDAAPHYVLEYDFVMERGLSTFPEPPIK
jgi:protocatechuate 3,4-dioxygenase beta subunit